MLDILFRPCEKVVETDNLVALFEKPIGKMGAQKTGTAGNEHALANVVGGGGYGHSTDGTNSSVENGLLTLNERQIALLMMFILYASNIHKAARNLVCLAY